MSHRQKQEITSKFNPTWKRKSYNQQGLISTAGFSLINLKSKIRLIWTWKDESIKITYIKNTYFHLNGNEEFTSELYYKLNEIYRENILSLYI